MARRIQDVAALGPREADALEAWREAAKRVTRAWNAWLAAEPSERAQAHAAYVEALHAEDQAAGRVSDAA
jgi:hypothetical protein